LLDFDEDREAQKPFFSLFSIIIIDKMYTHNIAPR
jgi:hypothetical protein